MSLESRLLYSKKLYLLPIIQYLARSLILFYLFFSFSSQLNILITSWKLLILPQQVNLSVSFLFFTILRPYIHSPFVTTYRLESLLERSDCINIIFVYLNHLRKTLFYFLKSALYKDQYFKSPYLLLLLLPLIYEHPFRIFLSTVTNRIQHRCRFVLPCILSRTSSFTLLSTNPFDIQYRPKVIKYWAASTYPAVWPYSSKDVTLDYFFARTSAERSYLLEEYPQLSHIHLVSSASQRSNSTKPVRQRMWKLPYFI